MTVPNNAILVTGRSETGARRTLERVLYSGWEIDGWVESDAGFACIVHCDDATARSGFGVVPQRDRIASLGWGGKRYPSTEDVAKAAFRLAPKGAPA